MALLSVVVLGYRPDLLPADMRIVAGMEYCIVAPAVLGVASFQPATGARTEPRKVGVAGSVRWWPGDGSGTKAAGQGVDDIPWDQEHFPTNKIRAEKGSIFSPCLAACRLSLCQY